MDIVASKTRWREIRNTNFITKRLDSVRLCLLYNETCLDNVRLCLFYNEMSFERVKLLFYNNISLKRVRLFCFTMAQLLRGLGCICFMHSYYTITRLAASTRLMNTQT